MRCPRQCSVLLLWTLALSIAIVYHLFSTAGRRWPGVDADNTCNSTKDVGFPHKHSHPVLSVRTDARWKRTQPCSTFIRSEIDSLLLSVAPSDEGKTVGCRGRLTTSGPSERPWYNIGKTPVSGCWTYEDRYASYSSLTDHPLLSHLSTANVCHRSATRAILFRTTSSQKFSPATISFLRSLVTEAGWGTSGKYHVYLSVHVLSPHDQSPETRKAWVEQYVPLEFQSITMTFTTHEMEILGKYPVGTFHNVLEHNHFPVIHFMNLPQNRQYDFVYTMEDDVRLIGRWDIFLEKIEQEYHSQGELKLSRKENPASGVRLPKELIALPSLPDLVTFDLARKPSKYWMWWDNKCVDQICGGDRDQCKAALGPLWGFSRALIETMHETLLDGTNCFYELFAPSVAYNSDLTTFFYQHPLYCRKDKPSWYALVEEQQAGIWDVGISPRTQVPAGCSYSFERSQSQPFWTEWTAAQRSLHEEDIQVCRPEGLIHPVKENM